tara:strand:+ start:32 stop:352 length:321 start_codon:yes stop_codon:yes gene_type:complete
MKKEDVYNEEINPDGISSDLDNLTEAVWSKGYYCETDDGIWYEVYVNDTIKEGFPKIDLSDPEIKEAYGGFHDIMLDHYESDGQITFFVPNGEEEYTLDELTDMLI